MQALHLHNPPFAHLDLKPGKVLAPNGNVPKICDFGRAYPLAGGEPMSGWADGTCMNTVRYPGSEIPEPCSGQASSK